MTLADALDLRRTLTARSRGLTYVVRRSGTRSLVVAPFYVAVSRQVPKAAGDA